MPTVYRDMKTFELELEMKRLLDVRSITFSNERMTATYDPQLFNLEQELLERGILRCQAAKKRALEEAAKIRQHMVEGKDTLTIGGGWLPPMDQVLDLCEQAAERYQRNAEFKAQMQYLLGMSA